MWLAEDFITSVKRRCNVPTSQVTFETSDFLALGDEETRAKMVPFILKHLEEYYVRTYDYNIAANQNVYPIPTRAVVQGLRDVQIVSSTNDDNRAGLERLNPEDMYQGLSGSVNFLVQKSGFYLQGNDVILYPSPVQSSDILRLSYYTRPNTLISTSSCGLITAINTSLNQVTLSSVPSNITALTPVDFVKATPGFECYDIDQTISVVSAPTLTFADSLPDNLAIGDYVCPAGYTNVIQVPAELQPLLFQYVVVRILAAQNDRGAYDNAMAELKILEDAASKLLAPRVSGRAKRVVNSRPLSRWV